MMKYAGGCMLAMVRWGSRAPNPLYRDGLGSHGGVSGKWSKMLGALDGDGVRLVWRGKMEWPTIVRPSGRGGDVRVAGSGGCGLANGLAPTCEIL